MALYIMEKLADDMLGEGERLYPRLVYRHTVDTERIAEMIQLRTSFTRGDVVGVLSELAAVVGEILSDGNSAKIDGLGVLRPVLGLVEKEQRSPWADSANRLTTERNVRLKTVSFRPDTSLTDSVGSKMSLLRASDRMGRKRPTTTLEERAAQARQYIAQHGYMRVADYAALTALPKPTAAKELRLLAADATSGITTSGRSSAKIYVAATGD